MYGPAPEDVPVTDAQTFAKAIAERHRKRERFTLEAPHGRAGDMDFAYEVQDRLAAMLPGGAEPPVGFKIGLTTPRMQQMCGIDEPIVGMVFRGRLAASPAAVRVGDYVHVGIESEIALRIGRALPAGEAAAGLNAANVLAYVDGVCAAFELVDDSGADYGRLAAAPLVADNAWNAGLVTGPVRPVGGPGSLVGLKGELSRNGEVVDQGNSSDVLGDPANALAWVVRHLVRRGQALVPGQWVSTGSIVPTKFVEPGETWRFEVTGFAPVELTIG
jgi:2-keto-4-pentenoate hydratase